MTTIILLVAGDRLELRVPEARGEVLHELSVGRRYHHPAMTSGEQAAEQTPRQIGRGWVEVEVGEKG